MHPTILFLILIFILNGCSRPQPLNQWKYDAASALNAYQEHFLQNYLLRAKNDLSRARNLASQSSDLTTRINIELSVCAMQLGILKFSACDNASVLLDIQPDLSQLAYLHLLQSELQKEDISLLPQQYRAFSEALIKADKAEINTQIQTLSPLSSRLIASALAKEHLNNANTQSLIHKLSYHGYKNPLLAWLELQMQNEKDPEEKVRLKAKIFVLTSHES